MRLRRFHVKPPVCTAQWGESDGRKGDAMFPTERPVALDEVRAHLLTAQERLSREKNDILALYPLTTAFNRETYAFAYVRAERLGMQAIRTRLAGLGWLPTRIDPDGEVIGGHREAMKRWLKSSGGVPPEANVFGNDFMHALTRCALRFGWNTPEFFRLAGRTANLFRELSCLIGVAWYCNWLGENRVEHVELSQPDNVVQTAAELAALLQSPEIVKLLRAAEQDDEKEPAAGKSRRSAAKPKSSRRHTRPNLRIVQGDNNETTGQPPV